MSRYFIEVSYKGTLYAGFQSQQNAIAIQDEVEKAMAVYFRMSCQLTGSSRTDAGVHALQNFFHVDFELPEEPDWQKVAYHLNAILPADIVVKRIYPVEATSHCRFDARYRTYEYTIYSSKDPFMQDRAFYYPYELDIDLMNQAAGIVRENTDFESFSKRNSQVFTYRCTIFESDWVRSGNTLVYRVSGNRFLRGMVRGLVGTMLKVGRKKITINDFAGIIATHNPSLVDFSVPPQGLMLMEVAY